MRTIGSVLKRQPIIVVTLVVLAVVLVLLALDEGTVAQWLASIYVGIIIVVTGVDMARDIMRGHYGLDILAVIAMVSTLLVGEYVASLIIVLMLTGGEALEVYAATRAKSELTALLERAPDIAHRVSGPVDPSDADASAVAEQEAAIEDIPVDEVATGDLLLVRPAEVVPVDGELIDEEASFDESSLTGESLPVTHTSGDTILSGAVNGSKAILIRATSLAADSQYQRILKLVQEAEEAKAPTERIADRFAVPFTFVSLLIGGLAWYFSGDAVRFAEVMVLATPCPLLIAAPVAFLGGTSQAARNGIIVKGGATLEGLARAESVAFDKTGTLSQGRPELTRIDAANGFDEDEILRLAASAEQYSSHVLAEGVMRAAEERGLELAEGTDAEELATHGVTAVVEGRPVVVGKLRFVRETDPSAYPSELEGGQTQVAVAVDGTFAGNLVMKDPLRPNAAITVETLRDHVGMEHIVMLTGDNRSTAEALAAEAGVTDVRAELLPEDKVDIVSEMEHRPVIMVGDGVNDAPVLAVADVGIAMGARGSTAASEAADVVITKDDIGKVVQAVDIGKHTYRVALTAIWIGVILSIGLMVIAAFGYIPAVAGALTQELVDLATILYALLALRPATTHPEVLEKRSDAKAEPVSA